MKISKRTLLLAASLAITSPFEASAGGYSGTYFGTFESVQGEWAMLARTDGTFEFIGFIPDRGTLIHSYIYGAEIDDGGSFYDTEAVLGYSITGRISNGSVSGLYNQDRFTGTRDPEAAWSGRPVQGYVSLEGDDFIFSNTIARKNALLIVGPSGRFVITAWEYAGAAASGTWNWPRLWQAGASGQFDSDGRAIFGTPGGLRGELWIDPSDKVHASITPPFGGPDFELTGIRPTNRMINLSTRGLAGTDDDSLISGFVIAGSGTKRVLIRTIGPSLDRFYVENPAADPSFSLIRMSDHAVIGTADNWGEAGDASTLADAMARTGAFPVPSGSKDAMLLADLPAGAYTTVASSANAATGVVLTEIYAVDDKQSRSARLVNISTRGRVGQGQSLLIPGFMASGNTPGVLLIRAVGPSLADYNVANPLADPVLSVVAQGSGDILATNDDWDVSGAGNGFLADFDRLGAFQLRRGSRDAVLYFYPQPDQAYTVVVSGKNGESGVSLVEIYEVEAQP